MGEYEVNYTPLEPLPCTLVQASPVEEWGDLMHDLTEPRPEWSTVSPAPPLPLFPCPAPGVLATGAQHEHVQVDNSVLLPFTFDPWHREGRAEAWPGDNPVQLPPQSEWIISPYPPPSFTSNPCVSITAQMTPHMGDAALAGHDVPVMGALIDQLVPSTLHPPPPHLPSLRSSSAAQHFPWEAMKLGCIPPATHSGGQLCTHTQMLDRSMSTGRYLMVLVTLRRGQ